MPKIKTLIASLALMSVALGAAAQEVTLRFPVEYSPDVAQGQANVDFVKRIEASSKGRIKVRFSPNGATFKGNDLVQALIRGDAEMTTLVPAYWTSIAPKVQLFDLPYAFPDFETFERVKANKAFVAKVYSEVESKGVKVLGLLPNTYIIPGTRNKQLIDPKDYAGVKLRGVGKINSSTLKALDANAVSINITEVSTALQQGVVDGIQTLMDVYVQYKFYDYLKFITDTRYQLIYYPWTVNAKWWNSLTPGDQKLIQTAVDEAIAANGPVTAKLVADAEVTLKAKGVKIVHLDAAQEKAMQQATSVVWKQVESDIGRDLIEEFKTVSAKK
ncbi:MAG: TRAP transporter substrate-binding protein DctP [Gammaproteobacteria bacterium]|nr:TRAP transporter substrate-binding protein DctP [Gammaproteobacteria bacterium]MBU1440819.1 TRAP transporter substrate-binding protein DctP [Gammaproteobacteria bacterium]MBU2288865.1 TRAP transporter substrate-binding protein DctP [Gammaproteobacteria bacterium]MBU2407029.1 TRAP transporter substrate-binding protein DctP [Gammaproteobacteria bacterium]